MDYYTMTWLLLGALLGTGLGWSVHAMFMRWYLNRHLSEHPEYKMYIDVMDKGHMTEKKQVEKTK